MRVVVPRATRTSLPISLRYRRDGEDEWLQGRVSNMSDSGLLFGPTNLQPGAKIDVILSTPIPVASMAPGQIICRALIVRTTEAGSTAARFEGCRFLLDS